MTATLLVSRDKKRSLVEISRSPLAGLFMAWAEKAREYRERAARAREQAAVATLKHVKESYGGIAEEYEALAKTCEMMNGVEREAKPRSS
jgi:hypothetical protein